MTDHIEESAEVAAIVRVSFFLRLVLLLVSLLGFINELLSPLAALAIVAVALTSMAGISNPRVPALLKAHPLLVIGDVLLMTGMMVALGTDNPLVLVVLSSCVIIGVLLPPPAAALCTVAIVAGYLTATLEGTHLLGDMFLPALGFPVVFVSVVVLGQSFRILAERKRQSERAFADLLSGTAAAEERARLARELHDSTAKTLQGLALTARSLDIWIDRDPARAKDEAREVASGADDAIVHLRRLLSTLRDDDIRQPFHESLAALARDVTQNHGVRLTLNLDAIPVSAPGVRYELLAAAREALVNAATHSGADKVTVGLSQRGEELVIEVADSGSGFDLGILPERERDGHFGVRGYSERLELIGGRAEVISAPGRGTRVLLEAPLMGLRERPAAPDQTPVPHETDRLARGLYR